MPENNFLFAPLHPFSARLQQHREFNAETPVTASPAHAKMSTTNSSISTLLSQGVSKMEMPSAEAHPPAASPSVRELTDFALDLIFSKELTPAQANAVSERAIDAW